LAQNRLKSPGAQRASGDFAFGTGCQQKTIDRYPAPRQPGKPTAENTHAMGVRNDPVGGILDP
jgi:hypothetical protein